MDKSSGWFGGVGGDGGAGEGGGREIIYLLLHCTHQNDSCTMDNSLGWFCFCFLGGGRRRGGGGMEVGEEGDYRPIVTLSPTRMTPALWTTHSAGAFFFWGGGGEGGMEVFPSFR